MSLIQKLNELANPQPLFLDPEDNIDETKATLAAKAENNENIDVGKTQLQRRATQIPVDDDKRYKGKLISRKAALEIEENDDDDDDDSSVSDDDMSDDIVAEKYTSNNGDLDEDIMDGDGSLEEELNDEAGSDIGDADMDAFKEKLKKQSKTDDKFVFTDDGDYGQYADDFEESEYSESEEEVESESDTEERPVQLSTSTHLQDIEEGGVQSFSTIDIKEEIKKGQAAKAQISLWDTLLEYRIRMQKLLVIVNQLPQPVSWEDFTKQGGEEYQSALKHSEEALKVLLDRLTQLQSMLLLQYPSTKTLATAHVTDIKTDTAIDTSKRVSAESDEEIPSDDEINGETQDMEEEEDKLRMRLKRKIKMADYPGFLSKRHQMFQPFRDETIQKWYDKTRVASGKLGKGFSAFESSAVKQIEQILSDKERLVKRTQLKRSTYRILGKNLELGATDDVNEEVSDDESKEEDTAVKKDSQKDYDEEIFDDDDFYHQLLRQLIERKTVDMNDPIALSRQWLEIQKLRSKVKKNVDTKASKGRKLRNDLFKSVFGGVTNKL